MSDKIYSVHIGFVFLYHICIDLQVLMISFVYLIFKNEWYFNTAFSQLFTKFSAM